MHIAGRQMDEPRNLLEAGALMQTRCDSTALLESLKRGETPRVRSAMLLLNDSRSALEHCVRSGILHQGDFSADILENRLVAQFSRTNFSGVVNQIYSITTERGTAFETALDVHLKLSEGVRLEEDQRAAFARFFGRSGIAIETLLAEQNVRRAVEEEIKTWEDSTKQKEELEHGKEILERKESKTEGEKEFLEITKRALQSTIHSLEKYKEALDGLAGQEITSTVTAGLKKANAASREYARGLKEVFTLLDVMHEPYVLMRRLNERGIKLHRMCLELLMFCLVAHSFILAKRYLSRSSAKGDVRDWGLIFYS